MELPPWSWAESHSQEFGYPSPTCELLSGWRIIGSYRDDSARSLIATRASIVDRQAGLSDVAVVVLSSEAAPFEASRAESKSKDSFRVSHAIWRDGAHASPRRTTNGSSASGRRPEVDLCSGGITTAGKVPRPWDPARTPARDVGGHRIVGVKPNLGGASTAAIVTVTATFPRILGSLSFTQTTSERP